MDTLNTYNTMVVCHLLALSAQLGCRGFAKL